MIDVTDATFEEEVLQRSSEVPVVVDLWAPWCGPCRTLGPIIEKVVDATEGAVALVKVNVDENPAISASFQVQSIPAVFALKDGKVVDGFIGALPEPAVAEFVAKLAPAPTEADLLVDEGQRDGTEEPLRRALELQPDHEGAILALAGVLIARGDPEEAIALLGRIPETPETRRLLAEARLASQQVDVAADGVDGLLDGLLDRVAEDPTARQEFLDLLETLGPDDPRTAGYRKGLGVPPVLTRGAASAPAGTDGVSTARPGDSVTAVRATRLTLGERSFDITDRALVMGILNRTPDSFYDKGATYALDDLVRRAERLVDDGADLLDVGGVKAGPGPAVEEPEELDRVIPALEALRARFDVPLSVDTWRASVAKEAYAVGRGDGQRHQRLRRSGLPGGSSRRRGHRGGHPHPARPPDPRSRSRLRRRGRGGPGLPGGAGGLGQCRRPYLGPDRARRRARPGQDGRAVAHPAPGLRPVGRSRIPAPALGVQQDLPGRGPGSRDRRAAGGVPGRHGPGCHPRVPDRAGPRRRRPPSGVPGAWRGPGRPSGRSAPRIRPVDGAGR